jgi:hypothetical protein
MTMLVFIKHLVYMLVLRSINLLLYSIRLKIKVNLLEATHNFFPQGSSDQINVSIEWLSQLFDGAYNNQYERPLCSESMWYPCFSYELTLLRINKGLLKNMIWLLFIWRLRETLKIWSKNVGLFHYLLCVFSLVVRFFFFFIVFLRNFFLQ